MEVAQRSLNDLPSTIIEVILSHLTYSEVASIRGTCKRLQSICGSYLKRSMHIIKNDLYHCMYDINRRLACGYLPLDERGILIKGYNMLQILNLSLNTLMVLTRHVLEKNDSCLPAGHILDMFLKVMVSMKKNVFGHWPALAIILDNKIINFTDKMEAARSSLKDVVPLGVRVMDLLDMVMDAKYEICVVYDVPNSTCYITGYYILPDSKILSYLPDISFISECKNRTLTEVESDIIMKYLVLLSKVHNGVITKSEHYRRELQFSRKSLLHNRRENVYFDEWFDLFKKPKRGHRMYTVPVHRKVLNPRGEIVEIYNSSLTDEMVDVFDGGVRALIQIKCALEQAPLRIMESFVYLKNDIVLSEKSLKSVDSEIFNERTSNAVQINYGAEIKLELRFANNHQGSIDLELKDGDEVLFGNNLLHAKRQDKTTRIPYHV